MAQAIVSDLGLKRRELQKLLHIVSADGNTLELLNMIEAGILVQCDTPTVRNTKAFPVPKNGHTVAVVRASPKITDYRQKK